MGVMHFVLKCGEDSCGGEGGGGCTDVPVMMSQIRLAHEIRLYTNNSAKQRTVLINSACDVLI